MLHSREHALEYGILVRRIEHTPQGPIGWSLPETTAVHDLCTTTGWNVDGPTLREAEPSTCADAAGRAANFA